MSRHRGPRLRRPPELLLCPQLTIKALHVAPMTNLGAPECCLRVSLLPLRLNVDQVSGLGGGGPKESPLPPVPEPNLCPNLCLHPQDALLFLKDYFTSLAAGINPMVPAETSAEGERRDLAGEGLDLLLPRHPEPIPALSDLQLTLRLESSGAAPRKGSPRAQRRPAPRRPQAAGKARPLSSSPSTSGKAAGGAWPGCTAPGQRPKDPLLPREFRFTSEVPIWLDYHGKHVSMDQVVSGTIRQDG